MHHKSLQRLTTIASSAAVLLASFVAVSGVQQIPAGASGCGTEDFYFDGTNVTPQTTNSAQASIATANPTLCTTPTGVSAAWVQIESNDQSGWAAAGYVKNDYLTAPVLYEEYNLNAKSTPVMKTFAAASGTVFYDVYYEANPGAMAMEAGNSLILTTPWDPDLDWGLPWVPMWSGETHYPGDNMPGTSSSPVHFTGMLITNTRGGPTLKPSGLSLSSSSSRYSYQWDTVDSSFHIWTN